MEQLEQIREEYITTEATYRSLAQKYGVSKSRLQQQGAREDWAAQRKRYRQALTLPEEDPNQMLRHAARMLLGKIELAITQLDVRQIVTLCKEKEVFFDNPERQSKASRERVTESEQVRTVACPVDRQGVQILAKALKDVQELLREETDGQTLPSVTVRLEGEAEDYAR